MNPLRQIQVAHASAALRALDGHAGERKELAEAAVDARRIDALYGSPFSAIAERLAQRAKEIRFGHLYVSIPECAGAHDFFSPQVEARGFRLEYNRLRQSEKDGLAALTHALAERIRCEDPNRSFFANYDAEKVARACWWAFWIAEHRGELPRGIRDHADSLLLKVGQMFQLTSARA